MKINILRIGFIQKLQTSISDYFTRMMHISIAILLGYAGASHATISQIHDFNICRSLLCWEISGEITKTDMQALSVAVDIMSKNTAPDIIPTFRLNSRGGDVDTAISIGRQLRKFRAKAIAWDNGGCYSSCVFIYSGAVQRQAGDSSIGIHRPYMNSTVSRDFQTIQNEQRRLEKMVKDYLLEVNVSPALYDAMVRIPSENIKLLSEDERINYGLLPIDPVQQELWDTNAARMRGISRGEYVRRKAQANVNCASHYKSGANTGNFDKYTKCLNDTLAGLM